jgi:hypothetical protein
MINRAIPKTIEGFNFIRIFGNHGIQILEYLLCSMLKK